MRTLCLLLILANALFFSWAQLIDVHVSSLDHKPVATAPPPRIVLAKEVTIPAEPATAPEMPSPPQATPDPVSPPQQVAAIQRDALACTSVGPFADLADASQAQAALQAAGFTPRQRLEQGELWVGHWVSVQNLATRAAAEAAVKSLSDRGITDVYLMPGSDPANVLSLGVFVDHQRAQRRADEVRALGLQPRIEDRKRTGSLYWIDADLPEPGQLIDLSIFQTDPRKIMRLELRNCPQAGGNSVG